MENNGIVSKFVQWDWKQKSSGSPPWSPPSWEISLKIEVILGKLADKSLSLPAWWSYYNPGDILYISITKAGYHPSYSYSSNSDIVASENTTIKLSININ